MGEPEQPVPPAEADKMMSLLTMLSEEFDAVSQERHLKGEEKYGPFKFMMVDTLEEALQELVDLANYARYTYIKARILQMDMAHLLQPKPQPNGFIKSTEFTKPKEA